MSNLYEWFHDDITWCCWDECPHTDCERHTSNMLAKEGLHSYAMFRNTEACPYYKEKDND